MCGASVESGFPPRHDVGEMEFVSYGKDYFEAELETKSPVILQNILYRGYQSRFCRQNYMYR